MEDLQVLSKLGFDIDALREYQIICLPENVDDVSPSLQLLDSEDSITLSKLLKEQGVKCANSYDLGLEANVFERRGVDIWLGSIWILSHMALPVFTGVVGRLLGEKIQKKLEPAKNIDKLETAKVHADLNIIDGKVSTASIKYNGDSETFLKLLNGINDSEKNVGD